MYKQKLTELTQSLLITGCKCRLIQNINYLIKNLSHQFCLNFLIAKIKKKSYYNTNCLICYDYLLYIHNIKLR